MQTHPITHTFTLVGHSLRNRMVVAPMTRISATPEGLATPAMADYYTAYAKGGFALIITEGIYTDLLASQGYAKQPGLASREHVASWKTVTSSVKALGSLIVAQLMHAGALSQCLSRTLAPSAIQPLGLQLTHFGGNGKFPLPQMMTEQDILLAKKGFVNSAVAACDAGFDGVEIHAANGYLLDQFLTPHLNQRGDHYGGSMVNRFRIIAEILHEVRLAVPKHFLVGMRLSEGKVNELDYRWPDGRVIAKELLELVKNAQPDFVHIAVQTGEWERDSFFSDGSSFSALARAITGKPIIANGGLHDLNKARCALTNQHADLIAIGKAALANPGWPATVLAGTDSAVA